MPARRQPAPRATEPSPIDDLFATAVSLDGTEEYLRLTGLVAHDGADTPNARTPPELRVVARLVLPRSAARDLRRRLNAMLGQEDGG